MRGFNVKVGAMYALTLVDLVLNGIADFPETSGGSFSELQPAVLWGVQMMVQLLNYLLLFMLLSGTYLFQVGLIGVLVKEFRRILYTMPLYSVCLIIYGAIKLSLLYGQGVPLAGLWVGYPAFTAFAIIQKVAALGYYVLILHTASRLGDPAWYSEAKWVAKYSAVRPGAR